MDTWRYTFKMLPKHLLKRSFKVINNFLSSPQRPQEHSNTQSPQNTPAKIPIPKSVFQKSHSQLYPNLYWVFIGWFWTFQISKQFPKPSNKKTRPALRSSWLTNPKIVRRSRCKRSACVSITARFLFASQLVRSFQKKMNLWFPSLISKCFCPCRSTRCIQIRNRGPFCCQLRSKCMLISMRLIWR